MNANPFVVAGYGGPEFFCDREAETDKLLSALANGRNVTLLAERRIGKTGLIRHVFSHLRQREDVSTVYVDIFATRNLSEFTKVFAAAIVGSMDSNVEKALSAATRFFKSFRPGVTIDPMTGGQTFSFGLQPLQVEATLKECFDYLATRGRCVVAIDEFQQVASYGETGTEALLRSYVQFLPDVRFVFAGSRHHLMTEMFSSAKRPFYNSTQTLPLERIDCRKYLEFANRHLARVGVQISEEEFSFLYRCFDGITWFVQVVLHRLYERRAASVEDIRSVIDELIGEKAWEYAAIMKSLPDGSVRLLKAIARAGIVKSAMSQDFIAANSLRGASSVHQALDRLLEDELLYESESGIVVYDRLFGIWLARQPY